ncbi:MAG: hypothetical protein BAJALOKI3v1_100072 [Promethearchaeota archaeon]|jgi:hypothetical protein|nr:MAG: hypothetical protein BAJALOKI3v1_100072 [Candidatus Lokiarchaeota archaeon]
MKKKIMKMEDCFDEILKFYNELGENGMKEYNKEKWLYNSKYLVKLMDHLDREAENYERVKNCLLFLINLCFDFDQPDHYHSKGKSPKELNEGEKESYKVLLKAEYSTLLN